MTYTFYGAVFRIPNDETLVGLARNDVGHRLHRKSNSGRSEIASREILEAWFCDVPRNAATTRDYTRDEIFIGLINAIAVDEIRRLLLLLFRSRLYYRKAD